jgi:hypothetical protein
MKEENYGGGEPLDLRKFWDVSVRNLAFDLIAGLKQERPGQLVTKDQLDGLKGKGNGDT